MANTINLHHSFAGAKNSYRIRDFSRNGKRYLKKTERFYFKALLLCSFYY